MPVILPVVVLFLFFILNCLLIIIIAHNIRSLHNVGAIFRSADAFAVRKVYLTGYTGQPPRKEIHKTALGSEDRIPWEYREDVLPLIQELSESNVNVLGLETGGESIYEVDGSKEIALVLGSEVEGINKEVIEALNGLVQIPMPGRKRSLNVSVAAGIAMSILSRIDATKM